MNNKQIYMKYDRGDFECAPLTELIDQMFVITDIKIREGNYGEYALVYTEENVYRTWSKVIIEQLRKKKHDIRLFGLTVTLRKKGDYHILE